MKKIYYRKLIRDKIPDRIAMGGSKASYRKLSRQQFAKEVVRKVEEEASGMQKAESKKELTEEIADVIDVINEVKKVYAIPSRNIVKAQRANMIRKGGFKKRLYLIWSSDDGYRTNEKRRDRRGKLRA